LERGKEWVKIGIISFKKSWTPAKTAKKEMNRWKGRMQELRKSCCRRRVLVGESQRIFIDPFLDKPYRKGPNGDRSSNIK